MAKSKPDARNNWIQNQVIARANELGLSAYAVAQLVKDHVSPSHVYAYLSRRNQMADHKLCHILAALGLTLAVE